jgi:hypothetical protein
MLASDDPTEDALPAPVYEAGSSSGFLNFLSFAAQRILVPARGTLVEHNDNVVTAGLLFLPVSAFVEIP